ncbi:MAG: ROK family protein [bacterium]|nr:ROK family protein [bacterium]
MNTIGIDIGGTKIEFALVDENGHILTSHRVATNAENGLEAVLAGIDAGVSALNAPSDVPVGVGCAGYINDGVVRRAVNLGWENIPLQHLLTERLKRRVLVENDVRVALMGERQYGVARHVDNAIYLAVGTGLGAAALVHGQLLRGVGGVAMELGQIRRDDSTTYEAWTSGKGLSQIATRLGMDSTDTHIILTQAGQGDEQAIRAITILCEHIADIAVWSATVLNPQRIIIGGGMGNAIRAWLLPILQAQIRARCDAVISEALTIHMAEVPSSAVGAAALVR